MRSRQRGLGGGLIAVILVVIAVIALASLALSHLNKSADRSRELAVRFKRLDDAFTQFVAASGRLPCPADPAADAGIAVPSTAGPCTHGEGTVPWQSVGARRDDAIDPWGNKISYRVYSATVGGLTQDRGASMVDCDTGDSGPVDPATGVCAAGPRDTGPSNFLAVNRLSVNDLGTARTDVAYVLVSHGETGFGAYTTSGTRKDLPAAGGSERSNTTASGPFTIKAFSPAQTDPALAAHFDDYVAYRNVEDLVRKAGLLGRNWPEEAAPTGASTPASFTRSNVETAVGGSVTSGQSVGRVSVTFTGVVASGQVPGGTQELTFVDSGGMAGIGVAGGGSALIQSSASESVRFSFTESFTRFGITLNDFGTFASFVERMELRFFRGDAEVGSPVIGKGCDVDGGTASFQVNFGQLFDAVVVTPLTAAHATDPTQSGITAFWVGEIRACTVGACNTGGPSCPIP